MAIYHLSVKMIGRSLKGGGVGSSVAASAYRAGQKIKDNNTGIIHDYTKKSGTDHAEIMAPKFAPEWMANRSELWARSDKLEKRKDAQLAREVEVALPVELDLTQRLELVRNFVQRNFVNLGMVADIALHKMDSHNPHCHILLTTRSIDGNGFGKKNREWNDKKLVMAWRENWEKSVNRALEAAGVDAKVSCKSLVAQGLTEAKKPVHLGKTVFHSPSPEREAHPRYQKWHEIEIHNAAVKNAFAQQFVPLSLAANESPEPDLPKVVGLAEPDKAQPMRREKAPIVRPRQVEKEPEKGLISTGIAWLKAKLQELGTAKPKPKTKQKQKQKPKPVATTPAPKQLKIRKKTPAVNELKINYKNANLKVHVAVVAKLVAFAQRDLSAVKGVTKTNSDPIAVAQQLLRDNKDALMADFDKNEREYLSNPKGFRAAMKDAGSEIALAKVEDIFRREKAEALASERAQERKAQEAKDLAKAEAKAAQKAENRPSGRRGMRP